MICYCNIFNNGPATLILSYNVKQFVACVNLRSTTMISRTALPNREGCQCSPSRRLVGVRPYLVIDSASIHPRQHTLRCDQIEAYTIFASCFKKYLFSISLDAGLPFADVFNTPKARQENALHLGFVLWQFLALHPDPSSPYILRCHASSVLLLSP